MPRRDKAHRRTGRHGASRAALATLAQPIGCGIDVVEIARFGRAARRGGAAFMQRVFTAREAAYAQARPRTRMLHLAGRFAAKEAVIKALAQLDPHFIAAMKDIEVWNDRWGRPHVLLHKRPRGAVKLHISLSHVNSTAVASAIAVRGR